MLKQKNSQLLLSVVIFFNKIFSSLGNINKFLFLSLIEKIASLGIVQASLTLPSLFFAKAQDRWFTKILNYYDNIF